MGARLHALSETACIDIILNEVKAKRGGWLVTMNLNHMRAFHTMPGYRRLYEGATMVVPDGMPLVWASYLQGTPLPERVTGSSLIWTLTRRAVDHGCSIFFFGGAPGIADQAAAVLQAQIRDLRIAGIYAPPMGFETDKASADEAISYVVNASPDIVYVALGTPKEDQFIHRLMDQLPQAFFIGVGASFAFVAGAIPRAPRWMQNMGLEWLFRLLHEPNRLARRYLLEGLPFMFLLMASALAHRFTVRAHDVQQKG
jgi:N-acetylglucosaminyldiphosphoundecaprenol N-acetyl-beta-D-mannosaminyltransferase